MPSGNEGASTLPIERTVPSRAYLEISNTFSDSDSVASRRSAKRREVAMHPPLVINLIVVWVLNYQEFVFPAMYLRCRVSFIVAIFLSIKLNGGFVADTSHFDPKCMHGVDSLPSVCKLGFPGNIAL